MTKESTAVAVKNGASPPTPSPARMIEMLIERDADMGQVEKLVDIWRDEQQRAAASALTRALSELQSRVTAVEKNKTAKIQTRKGGSYSYSYATLHGIRHAIGHHMAELGLSYSWDSDITSDGRLTCVCIVRHVDGAETRASFTCPTDTKAEMSGAQAAGAALTYAKRQSLVAALGLTIADDTDAAPRPHAGTVSEFQAAEIEELLSESGADRDKFFDWVGVTSVEEIPRARYDDVTKMLHRKKREAAA